MYNPNMARCCGAGILPAIIIQIKCSTAYEPKLSYYTAKLYNPQQNVNTSFFLSTAASSVSSVVRSQKRIAIFNHWLS
ncbi:MAG: hypothetical protein ACKN9K_04245 [Dolichospermum sp.]